jgi:heterodisulfide reductase subunit A2
MYRDDRHEPDEQPKVGVYVCHCGINIAAKVDVAQVVAFAATLPFVTAAREYKFMCSDPGQEMIQNDFRAGLVDRVVVASCSPLMHEPTFRNALAGAQGNPYLFQMANIREHVSWVTEDPASATTKAQALIAAAVRRITLHVPLQRKRVAVNPDVLIVGAGIAGIQAALTLAEAGKKVFLVEREPTIGGHMAKFDKTFPTLDCSACILTPKMVEVSQRANIELMTYSEVASLSGFIGNYTVQIERKPRYVKEGVCTGCGECSKVCPVHLPSEWNEGLGERKAIYRSFPQAVPITYCIDKKDRAPCVGACPAGVNVQGYVQLIGEGKYREAVELILEKLPLPGVLGRVCPHDCERQCRRQQVESPVAIRELKRFAADQVDLRELPVPPIEERQERVAVVGSGPAGLTAAYFLRRRGYRVTLFEALDKLGGMLRVGIPDYRLPPEILDREIEYVLRFGISVETGKRLGVDFTLEGLRARGFDAVFLAVGMHQGMDIGIPGETDFSGVVNAVAFLRDVNLGRREAPGEHVAIIGGGNVAIDAARVCRRLGCESVTVVYRRTRQEMPAYPEEIEDALAEGIDIRFLSAPVAIQGENGRISGLSCIRTRLGPPDDSGRQRPVPVEGSEFVVPCDAVISAIGQQLDPCWEEGAETPRMSRKGSIEADPMSLQTSVPNVFAAGDAVTGPATVIEAVAAGRRAAEAIHRFLNGEAPAVPAETPAVQADREPDWVPIPSHVPAFTRAAATHRSVQERHSDFEEVNLGLTETAARKEANRCLNCGACSECMACVKVCEASAIDHDMKGQTREVNVGSIIVATGYDLMDPTPLKQYGYGTYPNVFTSLEVERLLNATGPTGGEVLLKNGRKPGAVGIIHCVGSRDANTNRYCSKVCCMYSLKLAHLIKERTGADITNFYIDMRTPGKGYEEFYERLLEEKVHFIRGRAAQITDWPQHPTEEGKLVIQAEDTLIGSIRRIPVDMVVLSAAMQPARGADAVRRLFNINSGSDGWFLERHPKLAPVSTATGGVFLAGVCQGPKDIPESVAQAGAAAAEAVSLIDKGFVELEPNTVFLDEACCSGCKTCSLLCPYKAIGFDENKKTATVNQALCKGCGTCSAACPSGALVQNLFTNEEIVREIEGILSYV